MSQPISGMTRYSDSGYWGQLAGKSIKKLARGVVIEGEATASLTADNFGAARENSEFGVVLRLPSC
jgi:hypothetical protein